MFYPVSGKAPAVAPEAPANLLVLDVAFDYIIISWDDNSDNEERFIIERHLEGEDFARYDTVGVNRTTFLDYQVEPETRYFYRVYADNSDGASTYSNEIEVVTNDLPNNPPEAPDQMQGYFDNVNANILSWRDNSDNELEFKIYRSTDGGSYDLLDSVIRDVALYSDYLIRSNSTYWYYVVAENNYGTSGPSDTARVDVGEIAIDDTTLLVLEYVGATEVTLSWESLQDPDLSFTLLKASRGDTISIPVEDTLRYTDTSLISNTSYSYQLEVEDQEGYISLSNVIEVTTLPWFTEYRAQDSLILFYVFSQFRNDSILDLSWHGDPVNLVLSDTTGVVFADSSYLRLEADNSLLAPSAAKITNACKTSGEISIECWIKASEIPTSGPATILSLENENAVAFSLSCIQDNRNENKLSYFTNLSTNATDNQGNPDFSSKAGTNIGILQHVVYTHNRLGEEIFYLNGEAVNAGFRPPGFEAWEEQYTLLLANNFSDEAPWLGNFYMCALYNKSLTPEEVSQNYYASPFAENNYILNSEDYTISAWPNPSREEIYIDFRNENPNLEVTRSYTILLINAQGFVVYQEDVSDILHLESTRLDLRDLEPGIYKLILQNPFGLIDAKSIVITR